MKKRGTIASALFVVAATGCAAQPGKEATDQGARGETEKSYYYADPKTEEWRESQRDRLGTTVLVREENLVYEMTL